ncbi:MAG TPA: GGDEF domain-containing protein [Accumulibacter sp.]|uniref:GGDEF domain-containing protein n=1 Tax=Accumulibacter sp. TaxID=2053492 RepID=UPI0025CC6B6A|nr:GGDEF domain-containing protein [Accumulibacter sp.]MCM8599715.1 GGDEF domain-containing protein [Accumulibacter sp.]MCM8664398.1 GGDEF domain-containing protein [Accumulibacter sp.]HNC51615.1 GGDEF domain-containing protein [Accumulibacter sp.]HNI73848.1 GGDEF domain-containing protein [Accumulibacter sp.]
MFKHDDSTLVHSSRRASRRLHRRPPQATAVLAAQCALPLTIGGRIHHPPLRRLLVPEVEKVFLDLLAAETRITDLENALAEAHSAALTDTLTGALNRRGFAEACQRESARARRSGNPLALALIDLDDFKRLNDREGHQVGDEALVHLVQVLRAALRPSDILCRFGGEEFVLLLPDTALHQAAAAISRFQRQLAVRAVPRRDIVLSFSAGVVVQQAGESLEQALLRADAATYAAKRACKNRVVTG